MRLSNAAWIASHSAKPYGLMTIDPRPRADSASSLWRTTSWYQAGKSSDCDGSAKTRSLISAGVVIAPAMGEACGRMSSTDTTRWGPGANAEATAAWDGPLYDRFVQFREIVTTGLG